MTVFEQTLHRRTAIGGAAAAGAAAVLATGTPARADSTFHTTVEPGVEFVDDLDLDPAAGLLPADPLLHLLRRATYGPSPASIAEIRRLGADAWLDRQLNPASIADPVADQLLARLPLSGLSIAEIRAKVAAGQLKQYDWTPMWQLSFAAPARAIWSERQLFEVMVDFWANHLNVTCPFGDVWDSRTDYDRTVLRKHALGTFADLLKSSARHPAMLTYLDNRFSTRLAPNENYGRELLELHTVGLEYTESDVKDAAKLLTGLTVDNATGAYRYDAANHVAGPVRILGFRHDNATTTGGESAALAFLDYLALHPSTARRIVTKLCVRFVADEPPAGLVTELVKVYLDHRSAIVPVLRALFTSAEFAASVGAKTRTPLEDLAATVRVLGYGPPPSGTKTFESLYWMARNAGQAPMYWGPPNGYPDVAAAWASPSGLLVRWNFHLSIAAGYWPADLVKPADLLTGMIGARPATYGALIDATAERLLGVRLGPDQTAALAAFYGKTPASQLKSNDPAVGWLYPYLMTMLLNSPNFALR
ncbi:uncharacterized protein (DUF1800 family) [Actinoplanes octamycinicus]|uniref:Uncharacterized protein (DUF1800 family) n=1 Tax=Actinoplanes octamycinicus TaxID=135948 RepID=A0A7W7GS75_9ACTN|nr:DUF1800 domain-containing protein [Actinoplanes octamycinicus]MBB4737303.1 uncharacterized protein (DUF1800 family) [Actinoplanes octamycinicus]GIE60416.1 hypothetical protein Aoc01nite_58180 [Actinoplanes octamycinicus]